MHKFAWTIVAAAALAACGQHNGNSGASASNTGATSGSDTTASTSSTGTAGASTSAGQGGSTSVAAAPPTASVNTADASASPSAAVTPQSTTTASSAEANNTATMGASAGSGQEVFSKTCVVCHGTGVAGAPKVGDKSEWGPRIAQGKNVLYQHALQGFTGKKGTMPPKGGNTALADADVKSAVDYMVAQAK